MGEKVKMKLTANIATLFIALGIVIGLSGCYYDTEEELYPDKGKTTTCDTTNARYAVEVKAILDSKCNCAACHGGASNPSGIPLDNYAGVKAYLDFDKAQFISSIVQDGNASNMPKGTSKLVDCDINMIKAWINKGYPEN
jgi:cytochrome c553